MAGIGNSGGRNRKSGRLHLVSGTFRPDRHQIEDEAAAVPLGVPDPPLPLGEVARAEWDRVVARMVSAKTASRIDDGVLHQYVELFAETEAIKADHARLRKMSTQLMAVVSRKLEGAELVETVKQILGLEAIIARQTQQLRQGHMAIRQYLVELGLTPQARTRVKPVAAASDRDDDDDAFFGGRPRGREA